MQDRQAFSTYGHTWNTTHVTGFGLSTSGASVSFSTTANTWQVASQPSASVRVC